ncbi:MAG: hypothetical protein L6V81_03935 [Clostridium sp.]|nr:MAG: hypothetical protein L6V81_03935 [Clostridium sp.]
MSNFKEEIVEIGDRYYDRGEFLRNEKKGTKKDKKINLKKKIKIKKRLKK